MRDTIILGGIGVVALNWHIRVYNVEATDPIFWYVYAPIAIALGLFIGHRLCK